MKLAPLCTRTLRAALMFVLPLGVAASLFVACGGGVGSGGTGSFASGPITGFGSVIVNGVHFDDTPARVEDGDGALRSRDDLRLGMTVEIDGSAITQGASGPTASATRIRYGSEMAGPVGSVDRAGSSFMLLGQRVTVDATTVFDETLTDGLDGLATDRLVSVYAEFDAAAQRYRATRVEPLAAGMPWRLRGLASQVDASAQTLRIGSTSYGYAGAAGVPADLAAGQFVRLQLTLATAPLRWVVQSFSPALGTVAEGDAVSLKGLITSFGAAGSFSVNGRALDVGGVSLPAGLGLGVRVEVEGTVLNGVLRVSKVVIRSDEEEFGRGFDLSGMIMRVDAASGTFTLRGLNVGTARPDLVYENGSAADLRVGRRVEVHGVLSTDRLRIEATHIKFD
jgi:hypothetical protein